MRLLFLGDIVGRTGRNVVCDALPGLIKRYALDFVVINGENSAGGFGITEAILTELLDAGADCVTLGNHAFDQKDALVFIERHDRADPPDQLSKGHARQRRNVTQSQERRRGAGHQCDGPRVHARPRLSVSRRRCRIDRLRAQAAPTRSSSISTPRRRAKSRRWAISSTAEPVRSIGTHTHTPTADARVLPVARPTCRTPACAAITIPFSAWKATSRSTAS